MITVSNFERVKKLSKKIIDTDVPRCEYCLIGKLSADGETVLCTKKGVMDKDSSCKKFKYDPLKRIPKAEAPFLPEFSPEDFSL